MDVKAGKNELLLKVCQEAGGWGVYVNPAELPAKVVPETIRKRLDRDFPPPAVVQAAASSAISEAKHYAVTTIPLPQDCVLEVGGLAFRPDGKLLACTRRGEVWLIHNPTSDSLADVKFTRFATGLHEALGLSVQDDNTVFVVQRPELTKTRRPGRRRRRRRVHDRLRQVGRLRRLPRVRVRPGPRQGRQLLHHAERRLQRRAPGQGPLARLVRQGDARRQDGAVFLRAALAQRRQLLAGGRPLLLRQPGRVGRDEQDAPPQAGQVLRPSGGTALDQGFAVRGEGAGEGRERDVVRRHAPVAAEVE